MDRSFLSNADVVKASRDFVCMRLATYEDAEEAKFLKKVYGRGQSLENTVFAILDPNGNNLTRGSRGPRYRGGGSGMAKALRQIAANYTDASNKHRWKDAKLPEVKSLDLALNVASCDGLPLMLAIGDNDADLQKLRKQLLPQAWNEHTAGQMIFASTTVDADLRAVKGLPRNKITRGVYILEPDTYGISGKVLAKVDLKGETANTEVREALAKFEAPVKNHRQHVRTGFALGLKWETAIPVTDRMGAAAAKRLWGE